MTPRLEFDRVWKQFRRGQSHDSLRDLIPALARGLVGRGSGRSSRAEKGRFWALRDLSFAVAPGEVLGIIGPNGAGKSTTLKLLNRIMEPTAGTVHTTGRIGALIEISAGFHQDLTGRQNVFLQGAIMGMRKAEIARKFDEIVAFAGIEDFIDTPVKRYSSGMNARLGFAIAAHLEPDILIIDEVLAVGDAAFQQKAFGRIKQMATAGAPVVLVSHQLDRIAELCTKAILLDHGAVRATGAPLECINTYLSSISTDLPPPREGADVRFESVVAPNGLAVPSGENMVVVITGRADAADAPTTWVPAVRVVELGVRGEMYFVNGLQRGVPLPACGAFEYRISLQLNVPPGDYEIFPCVWDARTWTDMIAGPRLRFRVLERLPFYGSVQLNTEWQVVQSGTVSPARETDGQRAPRQPVRSET